MKHFFLLSDLKRAIKRDPGKGATPSAEIPDTLYHYEHDINTSDGSEFLDDSIRMRDQPLGSKGPGIGSNYDEPANSPAKDTERANDF